MLFEAVTWSFAVWVSQWRLGTTALPPPCIPLSCLSCSKGNHRCTTLQRADPKAQCGLAGTVAEWQRWVDSVRAGLRKPLGYDLARRRYWALGGGASAWRVYVEEQAGTLWGWYDGA